MNVKFIFLVVCLVILFHEDEAKRGNKGRKRRGNILKKGKGPHEANGAVDEDIEVEVSLDGVAKQSRLLRRQRIPEQKPVGQHVLSSAVYMSENEDIIYREDVQKDGSVNSYALVYEGDNVEYFNNKDQVLELRSDPNATHLALPIPGKGLTPRAKMIKPHHRSVRASLKDTLLSASVIKLVIFVDEAVVNMFKDLNNNNEAAAKTDVGQFFTLVANEMTIIYQTLKTYNKVYYRNTTKGYQQNFAVQIVDIVFPTSGGDFAFSAPYVSNGGMKATPAGALSDFVSFMATYRSSVDYDHAALITGYDLYAGTSRILGVAWMRSLCSSYWFERGYHTSVSMLTATISRTFAHELGHGFGIEHDISLGCNDSTYIMAQAIINPSAATRSTYFKFSSCSSTAVNTYTKGLKTDFRSTCLLRPKTDFFDDFCEGVRGMTMTLDKQCQRAYGASSYRCDLGGRVELALDNNFVTKCVKAASGTNPHPFYCHTSTGCYSIPEVLMGTNCVVNGTQDPNNVCFKGRCQSVSFCGDAGK